MLIKLHVIVLKPFRYHDELILIKQHIIKRTKCEYKNNNTIR